MATILYAPDGQPVQVFDVTAFLRQGYSVNPPNQPNQPKQAIAPSLAELTELTGSIDINTASIKELQSLPQVGVAIAKKIAAGRPYKDLSDLINRIPEIGWLGLRNQITLSGVEEESTTKESSNLTED